MELIAALLHSPRVLFLDEPTIGLDVTSQKKVREFLRLYNGEHRIITMLTSHYMQDIEELCERVIIIDHGKIHYDGPLAAIIDRFATYKLVSLVFAGRAEGRDFAAVRRDRGADAGERAAQGAAREGGGDLPRDSGPAARCSDINVQEPPVEDVIRQVFGERGEADGIKTDSAQARIERLRGRGWMIGGIHHRKIDVSRTSVPSARGPAGAGWSR